MAADVGDAPISTDYLVVGAGTSAMCFTDEVLRNPDVEVVMVDRRPAPGGHWLDAYPFVRLHQASEFYGINRVPLGSGRITARGVEEGFAERASGAGVCAHFDDVMQHRFLGSGRVRFLPRTSHEGGTTIRSLANGSTTTVEVRRSVVDSTHVVPTVPATDPPPFEVADGVTCVPVGDVVELTDGDRGYVIVGGGKTATDAIGWLIAVGVPPERITWIRPRDSWMLNRAFLQPQPSVKTTLEGVVAHIEAIGEADGVEDVYDRLEAREVVLRTDRSVRPTMMRGATVSVGELEQVRRVRNVVRLGHVTRIEPHRIVLTEGSVDTDPDTVHLHCASSGVGMAPTTPMFSEGLITLQGIARISASFSAAFTGFVESTGRSIEDKNRICRPSRYFTTPAGYLRAYLEGIETEIGWGDADLAEWVATSRLNLLSGVSELRDDPEADGLQSRVLAAAMEALPKLADLRAVE